MIAEDMRFEAEAELLIKNNKQKRKAAADEREAMAEKLEGEWKEAGIQTRELCHFKDTPTHHGCMHEQDWKAKGTLHDRPHTLC